MIPLSLLVLIAIERIGDATAPAINKKLKEAIGDTYAEEAIYKTLQRLNEKGFVSLTPRLSMSARGGRGGFYFRITETGMKAKNRILLIIEKVNEGNATL